MTRILAGQNEMIFRRIYSGSLLGLFLAAGVMSNISPGFAQEKLSAPVEASASSTKADDNETIVTNAELRKEPTLQRRVSIEACGISLATLLKGLKAKSSEPDVLLLCNKDCEEQKIQIRLIDRPLCALMVALAELLPGEWSHAPFSPTYRVRMTGEARRQRDFWWRLYQGEREKEIKRYSAAVLAQMRKPLQKDALNRDVQTFWNGLPPSFQEKVANQVLRNALYHSADLLYATTPLVEGAVVLPWNDVPKAAQETFVMSARRMANGAEIAAPVCLAAVNTGMGVIPRIVASNGFVWETELDCPGGQQEEYPVMPVDHRNLPTIIKKRDAAKQKVADNWRRLAQFQESRVWPADPGEPTQKESVSPQDVARRAETLDWMGVKGKMEFVADYYSQPARPLSLKEKAKSLNAPMETELNTLAARHDLSWKRTNDRFYLIRNNRWYRDDYLEAPNPVLHELEGVLHEFYVTGRATDKLRIESRRNGQISPAEVTAARQKKLHCQLAVYAAVAQRLTPWQVANGLTFYVSEKNSRAFDPEEPAYAWRPFGSFGDVLLSNYEMGRFVAALSAGQRAAMEGDGLLLRDLSAEQTTQLRFVSPEFAAAGIAANAAFSEEQGIAIRPTYPIPQITVFYDVPVAPYTQPTGFTFKLVALPAIK